MLYSYIEYNFYTVVYVITSAMTSYVTTTQQLGFYKLIEILVIHPTGFTSP